MYGFESYVHKNFDNKDTARGYITDAQAFYEYVLSEKIDWKELKERHIKNYNLLLKQGEYSDHSIARKNSSLRLFLKFLRKENVMNHNPMEDIKQPQLDKREVVFTNKEKELLGERMKKEARDYLLYVLLTQEKMKVSEIIHMQWENINEQNLIVYTKNKAVPIKEQTLHLLKEVKKEENQKHVLQNKNGEPLTVNGVRYILKKYLQEINRDDLRPNDLIKEQNA